METKVLVRVKFDFADLSKTEVHVIMVKIYDLPGGVRDSAKYALNTGGEWVLIPEATEYPTECILPLSLYNNITDRAILFDKLREGLKGSNDV